MAEYLDYSGLEYYHGKLSDELSDKQTQIDANTQSISSLSSTVISHTNSISALQNGKVDKVTGKGLSTNDFTNAYKAILDGGFDYVPYELVSGGSVDLDTLLLSRSDPPKKVYYCPQTTTLIKNFPTANNQIYGAFILEVSKTSQSQTEEKVTLVQKLYFFPSTGFETITAAYGFYTRSRGWTTNPTASLAWTAWERDKAAETAVSAEQVKQDYISGSDHDYPVLASGDYSLTQGSVTGTPFKMHGLKYNPKTGTLTANKFTGALIGNASTATSADYATTAGSATEADHATSADSATSATSATRVRQTIAVSNYNRPILLSYLQNTTTTTGITQAALYSNKFYANPSTGALTATSFVGDLTGTASEAAHATSADSATSANTLKLNAAPPTAPGEFPVLICPAANPTTTTVSNVYKTAEMKFSSLRNELIVENLNGNAKTATKLSGSQTVLYESTTATTSFTLSGLFTDWSAVMIYLTGAWVSGTSGTHGFFVPLKHLKNQGNSGITDFCGGKVINFLYVDDDSMRWFEYQGQGAMTYSSVKVVGLY
jgi:hypothetical protein